MNEFMIYKSLTLKAESQIKNTFLKHSFSLLTLLVISSLVVLLTTAGWLVFDFDGTITEHGMHIKMIITKHMIEAYDRDVT
jgi:hypothetical protein